MGGGRSALESLVDWKNDHPSGSGKIAMGHEARWIGQRAGIVAAIPTQDLFDARS
jgi:hypothetical protein